MHCLTSTKWVATILDYNYTERDVVQRIAYHVFTYFLRILIVNMGPRIVYFIRATGHVFLNDHVTMRPNQMYVLTILVRNVLTNASDETKLSVNSLSPVQFTPLRSHSGYDVGTYIDDVVLVEQQPLSRHKRAVVSCTI